MQYLSDGVHRFDTPQLFDWSTNTYSSPVLIVGSLELPEPSKEYLYDFAFTVADGIEHGAVAMGQFEGTEEVVNAVSRALLPYGVGANAVADANVLYCKSAAFHEDSAFNTIFVTAHWHGTTGDVVFPRWGVRVRLSPGRFVAFDCHEPHAFLAEGKTVWDPQDYAESRYTHLVSLDLDRLNPELQDLFELNRRPPRNFCLDVRGLQLCATSGQYEQVSGKQQV